jgi:starch synthase
MGTDILAAYPEVDPSRVEVIHNGIDAEEYRPDPDTGVLANHGIDPDTPYVLFVGRITRQKGIVHLVRAAHRFLPGVQVVLAAGSPDTPEIAREMATEVEALAAARPGVLWIRAMLERREVIQLMTHATVFVCPSIYEPLGIVNLEAMACQTAVVATATGGIPEVVEDGVTGLLVPFEPGDETTREPADPSAFSAEIAEKVNWLLSDTFRAKQMGHAGRQRVLDRFTWRAVAERTYELYGRVTAAQ